MATRIATTPTTAAAACTCCDSCAAATAKLADHAAATAAIYVTDPERRRAGSDALEPEQPQPTHPPPGLSLASASTAASVAHANRKPVEFWRPGKQPDAEKAAFVARGYQFVEPPAVSTTSPEIYKAALLAARERVIAPSPKVGAPDQGYDQSAAGQVMMAGGRGAEEPKAVETDRGALTAATGAVSTRRRAESAPIKPQFRQEAAYALTAATISHRASLGAEVLDNLEPSMEAARIHNIAKTNAQLYTASPPVGIEVAEQKQRDTLRAAAISMAKDMYAIAAAKEGIEPSRPASSLAQHRQSRRLSQSQYSWTTGDERGVTRGPLTLHEAAQKIAAEKLAKMQRDDLAYHQEYYGTGPAARSRLTVSRRLRRRTSSESDASRADWERSMQIRHQMSSLQSRLQEIDEKKKRDRAELMEIARRNVNMTIHDLDEEVYARTGKPSPSMQREWEEKAHERAKAEIEARVSTFGRIPIGGQRYMDEADVEEIARSRIQPTLDEISERVSEQMAREIERRLDEERRKMILEIDREREFDLREEEKRQKAAAKQAEKEQKAAMAEKKRLSRESQGLWSGVFRRRKPSEEAGVTTKKSSKEIEREASEQAAAAADADYEHDHEDEQEQRRVSEQEQGVVRGQGTEQEQGRVPDGDAVSQTSRPRSAEELIQAVSSAAREAGVEDITAVTGAAQAAAEAASQPPPDGAAEAVTETAGAVETSPVSTTPPKGQSRLKIWFKAKVGRRSSKPPPPEQTPQPQENQTDGTPSRVTGGPGVTANMPRGPLSSHPVSERDLAPGSNAQTENENDHADTLSETVNHIRQWSTSAAASDAAEGRKAEGSKNNNNNSSGNGNGNSKWHRLRMSIKSITSHRRSDDPSSAGVASSSQISPSTQPPTSPAGARKNGETTSAPAAAAAPSRPSPSRVNTMEREELRDSFVEEALPPPPSLVGAAGGRRSLSSAASASGRERRFSEDL